MIHEILSILNAALKDIILLSCALSRTNLGLLFAIVCLIKSTVFCINLVLAVLICLSEYAYLKIVAVNAANS